MTRTTLAWIGALFFGLVAFQPSGAVEAQDGWATLFDGSTLDGWNQLGDAN